MSIIKPGPARTPNDERVHRIMDLARANDKSPPETVARVLDRSELEAMFSTAIDVITCMDYALLTAKVTRGDLVDIAHGRR